MVSNLKTRLGHDQRKGQFAFGMEACAFTQIQCSNELTIMTIRIICLQKIHR